MVMLVTDGCYSKQLAIHLRMLQKEKALFIQLKELPVKAMECFVVENMGCIVLECNTTYIVSAASDGGKARMRSFRTELATFHSRTARYDQCATLAKGQVGIYHAECIRMCVHRTLITANMHKST